MKWSEEGGGRIHRGSLDIRQGIEADEEGYWSFNSCNLGFLGLKKRKDSLFCFVFVFGLKRVNL